MTMLTEMTNAEASSLWSGLLILLLGLLSIRVTLVNHKHADESDTGKNSEVGRAARVFSNGVEYIPISVGALILLYHLEVPVTAIHVLGIMLLAGRVVQAVALSGSKNGFSTLAGMALTFAAIFTGGGMLVVYAFL
ncbi:MAG: MAPEG family protein [Phenylobacterium sp.]|uniref:MAPEG family protein n=1 Tax=Phenylobacterium sp. TaxID=1871053 RepID=UPI0025F7B01F|nr:MAPEG family protein [Phenylobacterium sp.]MCG9917517.1 MAPEG family protein [Phenylobacterium sp.]